MFKKIWLSTVIGLKDNFTWEMFCFLGHRLSGIILALYIFPHIFIISTATIFGPSHFSYIMSKTHMIPVMIAELLLFAGVLAHMLNGIRLIIGDFFGLTKDQRNIFTAIAIIGFFIFSAGGLIMIYNFMHLHRM